MFKVFTNYFVSDFLLSLPTNPTQVESPGSHQLWRQRELREEEVPSKLQRPQNSASSMMWKRNNGTKEKGRDTSFPSLVFISTCVSGAGLNL
jgi:hypothetical protein